MTTEDKATKVYPTSSHWGNYLVKTVAGAMTAVDSYPEDEEPSGIAQSLLDSQNPDVRIAQPMVRKGYLEHGRKSDGGQRGKEPFVPVSWDVALDLAADALTGVRQEHGNQAIYGGSYGWASAGRFHHAQSQIHRFLRTIGGYVDCRDDYSCAAAHNIVPRVLGRSFYEWGAEPQTIEDIAQNSGSLVLFGGAALKNTQINVGGLGSHNARQKLARLKEAGVSVYNISPVRDDVCEEAGARWMACKPNTDTALMLGLIHTLVSEGLHDQSFLDTYCEGWDKFHDYLMGTSDGQIKNAEWASAICGIADTEIQQLARVMAAKRCTIGVSWSLQRQEHGEQAYWMAITLASALGYMGLPGGGITFGYGCVHNVGFSDRAWINFSLGAVPQGDNPIDAFIPVARISDMLLNPGTHYDFNGESLTYPDIRLIYWAGGNPFHHHQDLNRLRKAWAKPETIIVNESVWTATARHADIVFPATTSLERNDLGGGSWDTYLSPMHKVVEPYAQSRDDYAICSGLAERLGLKEEFTEGLDEMDWVKRLYEETRSNAAEVDVQLPDFDAFWSGQQINTQDQLPEKVWYVEEFRADPVGHPLTTPSGKIELFSSTIDSFNYADCPGHATWLDKDEWLGSALAKTYPLHLLSNQPKKKLHSQLDFGRNSRNAKAQGREIIRLHPDDAASRTIKDGDIVRVFNSRGSCLASAELTDCVIPRVVELPTGSWYDPEDPQVDGSLEVHGNPNVLTRDKGSSSLGQGPSAHSCLVDVELYQKPLPPIKVFSQPEIEPLASSPHKAGV